MHPPNAAMIGAGEYTTGFVRDAPSGSDKGAGVVALTLFDLRARGLLGDLSMASVRGEKYPAIREHLARVIGRRYGLDTHFRSFPDDGVSRDPNAYLSALDALRPGDIAVIVTPDDTHFPIAMAAVQRGCHALVAKPLVKTLKEHLALAQAAEESQSLVAIEVHKRWDPIYADARDRIRALGDFSHFSAYMSQPKAQLDTFRNWAGAASDVSYYLNAHHVDFTVHALDGIARPLAVRAAAAEGVAQDRGVAAEDIITLTVEWENLSSGRPATAVYTASWIAPPSDVHSQQRFHYIGHKGEINVDQARRGYGVATDDDGFRSPNPLFMRYAPDAAGRFAGRNAYGYQSIEAFVHAARSIRAGETAPSDWRGALAVAADTAPVTAILEAGRRSLDANGRRVVLRRQNEGAVVGFALAADPP